MGDKRISREYKKFMLRGGKMIKEIIEPFIILPYGDLQDIVFFINESIKSKYSFLIDYAYKRLSNDILPVNIIKVINRVNEIVIFHIYPTTYEERHSGRKGQYLIVGYIIDKKCFWRKYDNLIYACNLFFDAIKQCGGFYVPNLSIPTQFLFKVNARCYNEYINKYLNQARIQMLLIMENKKYYTNDEQNKRLKAVYDFIKRKLIFFREYWILVDSKEIDYYKKKCKVYYLILKE